MSFLAIAGVMGLTSGLSGKRSISIQMYGITVAAGCQAIATISNQSLTDQALRALTRDATQVPYDLA